MFEYLIDNPNGNLPSEENDEDNKNNEVGGLFHVSRNKKVHINDQEDYTLNNSSKSKHNWELDEV